MAVIDQVKAHFESLGTKEIKVPEWGLDDKPLIIYATPMTIGEMNKLQKLSNNDDLSLLVYTVIEKSLDKDGNKIFSIGDIHDLMSRANKDVLQRVVEELLDTNSTAELEKK